MGLYFLLQVGVLGSIPVDEIKKATSVASAVLEQAWGSPTAHVITVLIVVAAIGSVFAGLLGGSRVPFEACPRQAVSPRVRPAAPQTEPAHCRRAHHGV